ncbi:MAG: tRNA (N(6)-L-threonylcarbamoyladenosine(37)-C(2))-methylthiotransferase MtaB [Desulfobacteraceae bacterium]|nr:tRNA (N(6)-L-threonylcarbamoyladenosine(37)-C(2))-methylthiotransferase MtaB [Desulfobacteraceae bacterium]
MKKKFYIQTLGCKVNQYESDGIASCLKAKGLTKAGMKQDADVCIINTCAVTSKASMQSRQAIRKIIRENPNAKIIVTGCHAQTDPEEIKEIDHVSQIVCHKNKFSISETILDEIDTIDDGFQTSPALMKEKEFRYFKEAVRGEMTRAYLKIQDGCDAFCTYCIVPYARGRSRSMPQKEVVRHLKDLAATGFNEVIITGIHTGMYGLDLEKKISLLQLLEKIDREKLAHRIRLSSIEPGEVNQGLIDLAGKDHILCDHFHIPLQSGDNTILEKMKRPYTAAFFADIVEKIHKKIPLAGIGVDTLIGFPSETNAQFENTYKLIESLPVTYLHIFPFSARKGTPAFHFDGKVHPKTIKERCTRIRELDQKKRLAFIKNNLNKPLEGLVQHKRDGKTGMLKAVTSNYLTVLVNENDTLKGKIVDLIPEQCDSNTNIKGKIHNTL